MRSFWVQVLLACLGLIIFALGFLTGAVTERAAPAPPQPYEVMYPDGNPMWYIPGNGVKWLRAAAEVCPGGYDGYRVRGEVLIRCNLKLKDPSLQHTVFHGDWEKP